MAYFITVYEVCMCCVELAMPGHRQRLRGRYSPVLFLDCSRFCSVATGHNYLLTIIFIPVMLNSVAVPEYILDRSLLLFYIWHMYISLCCCSASCFLDVWLFTVRSTYTSHTKRVFFRRHLFRPLFRNSWRGLFCTFGFWTLTYLGGSSDFT